MEAGGLFRRWLVFNGVGALGVGVQLVTLGVLVHGGGVHYLTATAIAVEAAVLHNFAWHQRWTWRDRQSRSTRATVVRLARFHLLNGTVSLVGNVAAMAVLTGGFGMDPLPANFIAVVACSALNFMASEALVFRTTPVVIIAAAAVGSLGIAATASAGATIELSPSTLAAWQKYEREVDARYARLATGGNAFFVEDEFKRPEGWREQVRAGQISMLRMDTVAPGAAVPSIPDGRVHHWAGAVFVPGATLDGVLSQLNARAGRESDVYEDVLASKLLSREGDRFRIYMKLRRESVITVTYNTEHAVENRRLTDTRATKRSVSTKIAELADAGTPREREKPPGSDRGFLWRLNAYWRYEQIDGGVLIECESVSLSRTVPRLLRPFISGTVEKIARESLEKTLTSLRKDLTHGIPVAGRHLP
jgi:putative flippase GtrA